MSEFLKHFSKPYLVFFFWWLVINLDFVLILIGKEHILSSLIARYGYTIRTAFESIWGISTSPWGYIWHVFLYHLILPLVATLLTVTFFSFIMNCYVLLSDFMGIKLKISRERNEEDVFRRIHSLRNEVREEAQNLKNQMKSLRNFPVRLEVYKNEFDESKDRFKEQQLIIKRLASELPFKDIISLFFCRFFSLPFKIFRVFRKNKQDKK